MIKEICLLIIVVCLALGIDIALTYLFVWLIDTVADTSLLDKFWWVYLLLLMTKMLIRNWVNTNEQIHN